MVCYFRNTFARYHTGCALLFYVLFVVNITLYVICLGQLDSKTGKMINVNPVRLIVLMISLDNNTFKTSLTSIHLLGALPRVLKSLKNIASHFRYIDIYILDCSISTPCSNTKANYLNRCNIVIYTYFKNVCHQTTKHK